MSENSRKNQLYYGDNLDVLRLHVADESVDLVYLDPPFNSNANYNVLFAERDGYAGGGAVFSRARFKKLRLAGQLLVMRYRITFEWHIVVLIEVTDAVYCLVSMTVPDSDPVQLTVANVPVMTVPLTVAFMSVRAQVWIGL